MTLTHPPIEHLPATDKSSNQAKIVDIINPHLGEKVSAQEPARLLAGLNICAKNAGFFQYLKNEQIEELIDIVPGVGELIEKIQTTANHIISELELDDGSALIIKDLGVAADLARDR